MKCQHCGAEIGTSKVCEYCGTAVTLEEVKLQEQLNKAGCPKCGSTNIKFKRENHGEVEGKISKRTSAKKIVHKTVGFCEDCGFTWFPEGPEEDVKKRRTWLWVLGWICIFPVPLTILMLRKKEMKPALRYGIIAVGWLLYLCIALGTNTNKNETPVDSPTVVEDNVNSSDDIGVNSDTDSNAAENNNPGNSNNSGSESNSSNETNAAESKAAGYEAIYNEYSQKIKDATPGLVSEYNQEAARNTDGINGLATICNDKIGKLAEISNDGVSKMASYMMKHGGSYSDYESWANKLYDVYNTEAGKITDAYMASVM